MCVARSEVSGFRTSRTDVSRHRGHFRGVSSVGLSRLARRCRDVEGPARDHCRYRREAPGQRGGPRLTGLPGPGFTPCSRRYLAEGEAAFEPRSRRPKTSPTCHQPGHGGADRAAAQRPGRAGPGRRPADHLLAPGAPPPDPGLGGHCQPHPGPPGPGHPRCREAAEVVLHPLRRRAAQRVLAVRLHPLPPRGRRRTPRS